MPKNLTGAGTTRWARTGVRLTWKEWREDYLAGLLWIVGIFVVLWLVAYAVEAVVGQRGAIAVDVEWIATVALPATVVGILMMGLSSCARTSGPSAEHEVRDGARKGSAEVNRKETR